MYNKGFFNTLHLEDAQWPEYVTVPLAGGHTKSHYAHYAFLTYNEQVSHTMPSDTPQLIHLEYDKCSPPPTPAPLLPIRPPRPPDYDLSTVL